MKITETELSDLLKKVYEGMGMAYGDYLDCAHVITWLAMHGVMTLDQIARTIPNWQLPPSQPAIILFEDEVSAVLQSHPSLLYNGLPIELARYQAQENGHSTITLKEANYPFLLIPHFAPLPKQGFLGKLIWDGVTVNSNQLSVISKHLSVSLSEATQSTSPTDLTIHLTTQTPISLSEATQSPISPIFHHHNQNGLNISSTTWQQLLALSKSVLVPESEQSRRKGAGEQAA